MQQLRGIPGDNAMTAQLAEPAKAGEIPMLETAREAFATVEKLYAEVRGLVRARVSANGKISSELFEQAQHECHGLAWLATYVESLREMIAYAERLSAEDRFGETEELLTRIGIGEYLSQIFGGIPMNQGEFVRPEDFGLTPEKIASLRAGPVTRMIAIGNTAEHRARLVSLIAKLDSAAMIGDPGLDETMESIREEIRKFGEGEVAPHAHEWHLANAYIPLEIVDGLSGLGVFGLTIPEEYGGMGLGKIAMCVVTEELSRAYIGVGSLGTRSEIAAELILCGGTETQKQEFLPKIASGEILPTAVFTEPNTGSDLASLRTRAVKAVSYTHLTLPTILLV